MQKRTTQVSELPNLDNVGVTAGGKRWLERANDRGGSQVGIVRGSIRRSLGSNTALSDGSGICPKHEGSHHSTPKRLFRKQPLSMADEADLNRTTVGERTGGSTLHHDAGRQKTSTGFGQYL